MSIVLNNFVNDSRVLKECISTKKAGYDIQVLALHESDLKEKEIIQEIPVHRIRLKTRRWSKHLLVQGVKYLEFAIRIMKDYRNVDIIHCNDLEPLPIAVLFKLVSKGRIKIIYDAHEFETELGLTGWKYLAVCALERRLIRYADAVITVCDSIADEYAKRYNVQKPYLVMNCPIPQKIGRNNEFRECFPIREDQKVLLYQGGLYEERGLELLLEVFSKIQRDDIVLVVMGNGPLEEKVRSAASSCGSIFYHAAVSPLDLLNYTSSADIGIVITENTCLNHYYSLPNKFFEYTMAGLPVLTGNLPEIRRFVQLYKCGMTVEEGTADSIQQAIECMLELDLQDLSRNSQNLAKTYNWGTQEKVLLEVYRKVGGNAFESPLQKKESYLN
nr:glycosyltransferase [Bacillus sp. FJAT-29790]